MGIAIASIFGILFTIFSILLHLACAAAIVILFLMHMNAETERERKRYFTWMVIVAVLLVLSLKNPHGLNLCCLKLNKDTSSPS